MSGDLQTEIPPVSPLSDGTRTAAVAYLERTGNADLLFVLGLAVEPKRPTPEGDCETCGNKLPSHGVCRRAKRCREAARLVELADAEGRDA